MNKAGTYLPILGFLCFIFVVWKYFDCGQIWEHLIRANISLIIVVLVLTSSQILTATLRYKFFLNACGIEIKTTYCMHAVLTALSLNSLIPGKGGDIAKVIVLIKKKNEILKYSGVIIIEKLCDLSVLSVITLIGAVLVENTFWQFVSISALMIFISLILSLRYANVLPILGAKLQILPDLISSIFKNPRFFLFGICFCILLWIVNLLIIYLLLMAVNADVSATQIISFWPSSMLTGMVPITISGFGTRDAAFAYSLGQSFENSNLFAGTLLYTLLVYWYLSLISFVILSLKGVLKLRFFA